jgi:hypothetical protein
MHVQLLLRTALPIEKSDVAVVFTKGRLVFAINLFVRLSALIAAKYPKSVTLKFLVRTPFHPVITRVAKSICDTEP